MPDYLRIELITIGDELLLGFTIDTNAAFLAQELGSVGVEIVRRTTVGDSASAIAAAVSDALGRTGAAITTGGLGPTSDDLTKPAIAELFGRSMHYEPEIFTRIEQRWRARGLPGVPPATNRQQAMVPDGAVVLPNQHGTAPGIWLEDDGGRWVAMLPGVPREMRGMTRDILIPRLAARDANDAVVRSRTLRTTGIAESTLAERLGDLSSGVDGLPLAYLPGHPGVDLRLTARGRPASEADRVLADGLDRLRERVGAYVYGVDKDDLSAIVLAACRARGLRLAVAESCTGGLLGARLTGVPGSSASFLGGIIAYDNAVKESLLDVSRSDLEASGAVSEPVARAMAEGARRRTGADIGIGITGVAGPDGGSPDKPVGTVWLAVTSPDELGPGEARRIIFGGDREEIRYRASQAALDMVRRKLLVPAARR